MIGCHLVYGSHNQSSWDTKEGSIHLNPVINIQSYDGGMGFIAKRVNINVG